MNLDKHKLNIKKVQPSKVGWPYQMIATAKNSVEIPFGFYEFDGNHLTEKLISWAGYDLVFDEIKKFLAIKDWGRNIAMPSKISWLLAGGDCKKECNLLNPINLDLVRREASLRNVQFGDFMDLLIFGALHSKISQSTTIVSLGTSLSFGGKIYYPFIGGQEGVCTVLGVLAEEEIIMAKEYAFLLKK